MKHLNQFITEYIIKKKLDKPINSEDHYKYFPKTKEELIDNINELVEKNIYDFNCIDTGAIINMSKLFKNLDGIKDKNFDVSRWDVSSVEDMSYMFMYCKNFNGNLFSWDVSNVTNMTGMFGGCESFEGNGIENWNITNVESIEEMFAICLKLNIDFSNWNIKNIKNFENIFYNSLSVCSAVFVDVFSDSSVVDHFSQNYVDFCFQFGCFFVHVNSVRFGLAVKFETN